MSLNYRVYITPRSGAITYGDEFEATDYALETGVSSIRQGIDSTDFDLGGFFYDDVRLKLVNFNGKFNDEDDIRSIFPYSRDQAKVRLEFTDNDGTTISFRGLINEEATRTDITKEEIEFRILSLDSVIRNTNISGGTVTDGVMASAAFASILNVPAITSVLNFDVLNINPDIDIVVDSGAALEGQSTRDALNKLLVATNSVMLIDDDDNIIIRSRDVNHDVDILYLYGPYDLQRRCNIIDMANYNNGKHRMFTAIKVGDTEVVNEGFTEQYGYRQKALQLDFITDPANEELTAERILDEFKAPKIELEVVVKTSIAKDIRPLDPVSVYHPLNIYPAQDAFFPIVGDAIIGDTLTPLPRKNGTISIAAEVGFKVIEKREDPKNFVTTLKLRQIGKDLGDGTFTSDQCGIVGFATIGVSTVCGTGDPADTFNPSVIGAAVIGYTEAAS